MKRRYPYWVALDIPGLKRIEVLFGPLVPLAMVRRLVRRSKQRVYRAMEEGKLRCVMVMGQKFTPVADVEKVWPEK